MNISMNTLYYEHYSINISYERQLGKCNSKFTEAYLFITRD